MQTQAKVGQATISTLVFPNSSAPAHSPQKGGCYGEVCTDRPRMFLREIRSREEESSGQSGQLMKEQSVGQVATGGADEQK